MKLLRILTIVIFLLAICHFYAFSQDRSDIPVWKDGFSEKEYEQPYKKVDDVILKDIFGFVPGKKEGEMTGKIIIAGTQKIDGGEITTYGVGDKNGKWRNWSGVETVKGLKPKDGGSIIKVKLVKTGYNTTTVGFNVDEVDKKQSESMHNILKSKMQK
jgi:hypothetical protein